jgi:hypothetical protein
VAVSTELSLIDTVHRDLLRAILAHKKEYLDTLVYITSTFFLGITFKITLT